MRALMLILGSWTAMRAWMLWPDTQALGNVAPPPIPPPAKALNPFVAPPLPPVPEQAAYRARATRHESVAASYARPPSPADAIRPALGVATAEPASPEALAAPHTRSAVLTISPPGRRIGDAIVATGRSRLTVSSWAITRGGPGTLALGGELGGSQAGVRAFYEPGPKGVALTARISTPFGKRTGREASFGVGLHGRDGGLLIERRVALGEGGRNAMAVTAYSGVSDIPLPADFRLDGYAQAGVIGVKSRDGFADGAVRVERAIAGIGAARIAAGAGVWAGAQPGVARVDAGPQLVAHLSVGAAHLRISGEYRLRVAGDAAPGSGPAISVGIDF